MNDQQEIKQMKEAELLTAYIPVRMVRTGVVIGTLVVVSSVVEKSPRTPSPLRAYRELRVARREFMTTTDTLA
jgi:hypothetical protein